MTSSKQLGSGEPPNSVTYEKGRPFYYRRPTEEFGESCYVAPSGWYQWTKSGLQYLGESILEANDGV